MRNLTLAATALLLMTSTAFAERYVMITHTQGTDTFWPVVEKGGRDAAAAIGADFEYNFAPSGDMADMASLIEAATATQPDGIVVSLPDVGALGPAIQAAVASGVPVITINSGADFSRSVGAIMHIGQPERLAGEAAGRRAREEGAVNGLCLNHEAFNASLVERCEGYFEGRPLNMIDVSNDVAQIEARTAAALQSNTDIDSLLAVGPHVCEAAAAAIDSVGADIHLSCFDLTPGVINLIKDGKVAYAIDQQQRLQGYLPVIFLHLYTTGGGLLPGSDVPSGPGFVDQSNAAAVEALAGVDR
ncbi:sugar ABC transporter substrate-binding protein [Devosia sp.]|uniref:sugar ABC transporter substrate-binding protein n=1 Tax=Devosia sp. TaxID=1871048 RepID=UPI002AFF6C83|nr:sugar ABC transporter substrate-binding protein [Devosia sp.]